MGKSFTWKGKSAKESPHGISSKELVLLPAPNVDEVPRFGKKRKLREMGLIVDGFPLDKNWDESQLQLRYLSSLPCSFYCAVVILPPLKKLISGTPFHALFVLMVIATVG